MARALLHLVAWYAAAFILLHPGRAEVRNGREHVSVFYDPADQAAGIILAVALAGLACSRPR